jgi:uncharacterized protein YukE
MRVQKVLTVLFSGFFITIALLTILNFQSIFDWYRLRGYTPPAEIAVLADVTTMNSYGEKLFYVNRPELNDKTTFQQNCTSAEASIVLGCYVSNRGIYIYDVQDDRLAGIEEVTAAHEMLHVGYERLNSSERERVDQLTAESFSQIKNKRIIDTVEQYRQADASVVPNELHSILATEVAVLPAELEEHYKQFFDDRSQVVALAERYEAAFTKREEQIARFDRQLASLETSINSARQEIDGLNIDLQNQRQQLDGLLSSGNASAYNNSVEDYNAAVQDYNRLLKSTEADIQSYNRLVKERNEIALEERELYQSLDSRTLPQEQ